MKEEQSVSEQASDLQMYRFKPMNDLRNLVVHSRWAQHVPTLGSFFCKGSFNSSVLEHIPQDGGKTCYPLDPIGRVPQGGRLQQTSQALPGKGMDPWSECQWCDSIPGYHPYEIALDISSAGPMTYRTC